MLLRILLFLLSCVASDRPNIVWIMADDLGWGEVGAFASTPISTPNVDKLASEGMRFTNAYAGYTVCAPSRTTFFTGRHSGHFRKYGYSGTELKPGEAVTTAEVLKKAGYQTGAVGKIAPLDEPTNQGFDYFFGQLDQGDCHNMYPMQITKGPGKKNVFLPLNNKTRNREVCMKSPESFNYTTDMFRDNAIEFLQSTSSAAPFFLYLSLTVPHAGGYDEWNAEVGNPVPTDLKYASESWPVVERDHAATITYMDSVVGAIIQKLKEMEVEKNTLVILASDNGAHNEGGHRVTFFNSTGGLKGFKRSLYEGGVRSPTIARWPDKIKAGSVSDYPWAFWDVMPTFAEVGKASAYVPNDIDGHSIVPTLFGKSQPLPEYTYFTWGNFHKHNFGYSVRIGEWKAVAPLCSNITFKPDKTDLMEIYNLEDDPFETNDLSDTKSGQSRVQEIKKVILKYPDIDCHCYQC